MGVRLDGGDDELSPLAVAILLLVVAAALVILSITAAPGDRGIPEEHPTTTAQEAP